MLFMKNETLIIVFDQLDVLILNVTGVYYCLASANMIVSGIPSVGGGGGGESAMLQLKTVRKLSL